MSSSSNTTTPTPSSSSTLTLNHDRRKSVFFAPPPALEVPSLPSLSVPSIPVVNTATTTSSTTSVNSATPTSATSMTTSPTFAIVPPTLTSPTLAAMSTPTTTTNVSTLLNEGDQQQQQQQPFSLTTYAHTRMRSLSRNKNNAPALNSHNNLLSNIVLESNVNSTSTASFHNTSDAGPSTVITPTLQNGGGVDLASETALVNQQQNGEHSHHRRSMSRRTSDIQTLSSDRQSIKRRESDRSSFHLYAQECGSIVTVVSSLIVQMQGDLAKVLVEKFSTYTESSTKYAGKSQTKLAAIKENENVVLFKNLFNFRRNDFYKEYLRLIDASSRHCLDTFCQILLQWLPNNMFVCHMKNSKRINPRLSLQMTGISAPMWCYDKWISNVVNYDCENEIHKQAVECMILIVIGDILAVLMRHYHPQQFRSDIFQLIINICFTVFYHAQERAESLMSWKHLSSTLFDQYSFVIRRLSFNNLRGILDIAKERIPIVKNDVSKQDIIACLKGIRLIDIQILDGGSDVTRDLFEYLVKLCDVHRKSIKVRIALIDVIINVIRQIDFEIQYEARLLDTYITAIYQHAEKWSKKGDVKIASLRLMSTILVHYLFAFHEKHSETVMKSLLKAVKKEDVVAIIDTIGILMQDKCRINKNLDLINSYGPSSTHLEKDDFFRGLVYGEMNKNTVGFDEEFIQGETTKSNNDAEFITALSTYRMKMKQIVDIIHKEFFDTKKPPILYANAETFDESIMAYTKLILRMATFSLDSVLQKTIPSLLREANSKMPELLVLGVRAIKLLASADNSEKIRYFYVKDELTTIRKNPNYQNLIAEFRVNHSQRLLTILRTTCENQVGIDTVLRSANPIRVSHYMTDKLVNDGLNAADFMDDDEYYEATETDMDATDNMLTETAFTSMSSRSFNHFSHKPALFEASQPRSRSASDMSTVSRRRSMNGVDRRMLELRHRKEKATRRKYSVAAKIKKDKFIVVHLLHELVQCIGYISTEELLSCHDASRFIGNYLIYNDTRVAVACSHLLQIIMANSGSVRHSIMKAIANLLLMPSVRDDTPSYRTIFDNICVLLDIWRRCNLEQLNKLQNNSSDDLVQKLRTNWSQTETWIYSIEAACVGSLCSFDLEVKRSAMNVLEEIHKFCESEGNSTISEWKLRTTVFSLLKEHEYDIVQQSLLRLSLTNVNDVESDVDARALLDNSTITSILFRENSQVLWGFIVAMIGQTLLEFGVKGVASNLLHHLTSRIKNFPQLSEADHSHDESFAFFWTASISLLLAITGIAMKDQNSPNALQEAMVDSCGALKALSVFDVGATSNIAWVSSAVHKSTFCINYQFVQVFCRQCCEWMNKSGKNIRGKTDKRSIMLLYEMAKTLSGVSQSSQLHKAFATLVENNVSSALRLLVDLVDEVDLTKVKHIHLLRLLGLTRHFICVALKNISWAITYSHRKCSNYKSLRICGTKITDDLWSQSDRSYWIAYCMRFSNESFADELIGWIHQENESVTHVDSMTDQTEYILRTVLPRIACESITNILSLGAVDSLFPEKLDYNTFKRSISGFITIDKRGYECLSKILYHHFESVFLHYIRSIYNESKDTNYLYVNALHQTIFDLGHNMAPRIASVASRVREWIDTEHELEMRPDVAELSIIKTVNGSLSIVIHCLLYLLVHNDSDVHSKAFDLLYEMMNVNFGCVEVAPDYESVLSELSRMKTKFKTRSTAHLSSCMVRCSEILAGQYSGLAETILGEAYSRLRMISNPMDKLNVIQLIIPWIQKIDLGQDKERTLKLLSVLFDITFDVSKVVKYGQELDHLWRSIAQLEAIDRDEKIRLKVVLQFLLETAAHSRVHTHVCRSIISTLYNVSCFSVIDILVKLLSEESEQKMDDDFNQLNVQECKHASISVISDILGESDDPVPIFNQLHIVLPYILVHMEDDENSESVIMEEHPLHHALLMILQKFDTTHASVYSNITSWIKNSRCNEPIYFNWSNEKESTRLQRVVYSSISEEKKPIALKLLPYITSQIGIDQFMEPVIETLSSCLGPLVLNNMASYCLQAATFMRDNATSMYKYMSLYKNIIMFHKESVSLLDRSNIQQILLCMRHIAHDFYRSDGETYSNDSSSDISAYLPEFVAAIRLCISILRVIAVRLIEVNQLASNSDIFWIVVSLLSTTHPDVYADLIDVLYLFYNCEQTRSCYFRGDDSQRIHEELENYTFGWDPAFTGLQPLLLRGLFMKSTENRCLEILMTLTAFKVQDETRIYVESSLMDRRYLTSTLFLLPMLYVEYLNNSPKFAQLASQYAQVLSTQLPNLSAVFSRSYEHPDQFISYCCAELVRSYFNEAENINYLCDTLFYIFKESETIAHKAAALKMTSYVLLAASTHYETIRFAAITKTALFEYNAVSTLSATVDEHTELLRNNLKEMLTISFEVARQRKENTDIQRVDSMRINEACKPTSKNPQGYTWVPMSRKVLTFRILDIQSKVESTDK